MDKILNLFFLSAVCILLTACAGFSDSSLSPEESRNAKEKEFNDMLASPVEYAVSFHTLLKRPKNPENQLTVHGFYGEVVTVEKLPWLTSLEIQDIIPVERPLKIRGIYDLKLLLTDKGRKQWDSMVKNDSKDSEGYAVLIDGVFYVAIHPRRFYKESSRDIVLDGPFDQVTATRLNKNAPFNFLKLKKSAKKQK